jgi:hypothetical protein
LKEAGTRTEPPKLTMPASASWSIQAGRIRERPSKV